MFRRLLAFLAFALISTVAHAQPASCSVEAGLQGRPDVIHCEPFTSSTWYLNSAYHDDQTKYAASKNNPAQVRQSSVVTAGCLPGSTSCLRVECPAWNNGGCGGAVNAVMELPGTQDEVYLRYYIKLAPNWTTTNICNSASLCGTVGAVVESGGKFPGLADGTTNDDAPFNGGYGQCGNGGAPSDGLHCWSSRTKWDNCLHSNGSQACQVAGATTRFGNYWYLYDENRPPNGMGVTNQAFGNWDTIQNHSVNGGCTLGYANLGSWAGDASGYNTTPGSSCGIGNGGLANDVWYRVEMHIKMNTPGVADGVAEGWIDGVLKYRKTNVMFRLPGHDNLRVRNVWFEMHAGGEGVGPPVDTFVMFDKLAVCTKARCGAFKSTGSFVSNPFSVTVGPQFSTDGGACRTTGGATYLESASKGIRPGEYCRPTFQGVDATLGNATTCGVPYESALEYTGEGAWHPGATSGNGIAGIVIGPHSGTQNGGMCGVQDLYFIRYQEASNTWFRDYKNVTGLPLGGHGYDQTTIDPATGEFYYSPYNAGSLWKRNPSTGAWTQVGSMATCNGATCASGVTWDTNRNGYWRIGDDDENGAQFWSKATGTFSQILPKSAFAANLDAYHFWAGFHPPTNRVWFMNGSAGATGADKRSWIINTDNSVTAAASLPNTVSSGCCGGGDSTNGPTLTTYDPTTQKFIVAQPWSGAVYSFAPGASGAGTFTSLRTIPFNINTTLGLAGSVFAISNYGTLLYIIDQGVGSGATPTFFLYKPPAN